MSVIEKQQDYEQLEIDETLRTLVTARPNKKIPIYDWYVYPHSFARDLVNYVLDEFEIKAGSIVLDPCIGTGSTALACKERGVSATGYDLLPLSVLVSNVKTRDYDLRSLEESWEVLLSAGWQKDSLKNWPDMDFFAGAFNRQVLKRILQIRGAILKINPTEYCQFFLLGLIAILEKVSKTAKGGGWLRWRTNDTTTPDDVDTLFKAQINKMINDLKLSPITSPCSGSWYTWQADARDLLGENQYDAVITSPPYLNRHDYTRIFLLELVIPFLLNGGDIKNLRYESIRSHVEAKKQSKNKSSFIQPDKLKETLEKFKTVPVNNSKVPEMIAGYFEDMFLMLQKLHRLCKSDAGLAFVLGNVRFSGVMIPVDEITAEIGEQVGLRWLKTIVARLRGNSAQQMGKYGQELSRESLILWKK